MGVDLNSVQQEAIELLKRRRAALGINGQDGKKSQQTHFASGWREIV